MTTVRAEIPRKIGELLDKPSRYKVLYGGRGSGKSWGVARALIIKASNAKLRVLCTREIQNSIAESVHQLLTDQIALLGLGHQWEIHEKELHNRVTGSQIWFTGLRTLDSLKSKEGLDVCWVEEAQTVTKKSWEKLIPTIRKEGSEIWITFNPELETDETYRRFVLTDHEMIAKARINWSDNKFFTGVLDAERRKLKVENYDDYLTVYEGHCRHTLEGAVYARELREATTAGRITRVPYNASVPVHTFWDLGWRDSTSIWFAQSIGFEYRIIDYVEAQGRKLPEYLQILQNKGYVYGTDYLPHDADSESLAQRSIAQLMREAGRTVVVIPVDRVANGLNAVRTMFPNFWFDEERCSDGLNRLRRYRYGIHEKTGLWTPEPLHDENSHAADALRGLAMSLKEPTVSRPRSRARGRGSWMGG